MSDRGDQHLSVIVREDTLMVSYREGIVNYIVGAGNVFFVREARFVSGFCRPVCGHRLQLNMW